MLERIPPREWHDLAVSWFALTLAFTVAFLHSEVIDVNTFFLVFVVSSITVGVGFILHELAHKFTAMNFGYWAEFQKNTLALVAAVVLAALTGIVFAAPGATVIYANNLSRREDGIISAAGPIANILLALPFMALAFLGGSLLGIIGFAGWQVNGMLAAFNMLPVGPLDGRKVLAWSPGIFLLLIAAAVGILGLSYFSSLSFF